MIQLKQHRERLGGCSLESQAQGIQHIHVLCEGWWETLGPAQLVLQEGDCWWYIGGRMRSHRAQTLLCTVPDHSSVRKVGGGLVCLSFLNSQGNNMGAAGAQWVPPVWTMQENTAHGFGFYPNPLCPMSTSQFTVSPRQNGPCHHVQCMEGPLAHRGKDERFAVEAHPCSTVR